MANRFDNNGYGSGYGYNTQQPGYGNGYKAQQPGYGDESLIDKKQLNRYADDAFKKGANALKNADPNKTEKMFGLFEADAGLVAYISTIYNVASDYAAKFLAPQTQRITESLGKKVGIRKPVLGKVSALTTFGVTVGLKAGGYVGPIIESISAQRKERISLARSLAPVLDELKGRHSIGALYGVKEADNEVIYAHRKRLSKIDHNTNFNNVLDMAINAGPNMLMDVRMLNGMWKGKSSDVLRREELQRQREREDRSAHGEGEWGHLGRGLLNTTSGQLSSYVKKSNENKLARQLQPYSALEMILELDKQIESNPKASSFEVPKSYQSPKKRGDSYPLEEYVMRIFIQHQQDMADISPDHTEIREALKEDLAAAAKPVADALRKGELNPLGLIRLVGEGKIIRNHGRSIAHPDEVNVLLDKNNEKRASYVHADPEEYYKNAAFTRDDLKAALKSLDGEERDIFASMLPDSVLEEAGMSTPDIKQMRAATLKNYQDTMMQAMLGLNSKSDQELQHDGLSKHEISHLREISTQLQHKGVDALKELNADAASEHGVEHLMLNCAVPRVLADKSYLGTVLEQGALESKDLSNKTGGSRSSAMPDVRVKPSRKGFEQADNAQETSHSQREQRRAEAAKREHSFRD